MRVIEADFWCEGDYGDEDGKCSNKKVRVDIDERWEKKYNIFPNYALDTHLLRIRILRQGSLWLFGEASFSLIQLC